MSEPRTDLADPETVRLSTPSGRLIAHVAPALGGELCGLQLVRGGVAHELLYRGMNFGPTDDWIGRAPILWPATGRNYPAGSEPTASTFRAFPLGWTHRGIAYPMPVHGFARNLPWRLDDSSESTVRLLLHSSLSTRAFYPFDFAISVQYELTDLGISLCHSIKAHKSNDGPMPFSIGNHITFRVPLLSESDPARTILTTSGRHILGVDATGRLNGDVTPNRYFADGHALLELEPRKVYAFTGYDDGPIATLEDLSAGLSIRLTHRPDRWPEGVHNPFVFWGDPAAGFVSLEPWVGTFNSLATGLGIIKLSPGEAFRWQLDIDVADRGEQEIR